jgi:tRNA (guanine10-N2)-dimethyltransferase
MPRSRSPRISGPSPSRKRILFLLSGESTTIPAAEASALVRMRDRSAEVEVAEGRVLMASSETDPDSIAGRIAFSKRVGSMIPDGRLDRDQLRSLREGTYRVNVFELGEKRPDSGQLIADLAEEIGGRVSLRDPDHEVTVIRGARDYFALSRPSLMRQDWVVRRPRARPFFHPAAIFPKLSRALVNLSRVDQGEVFLDPFCGTGSLLLEAHELGARPLGADRDSRMVKGALRNMASFRQDWLGVIRAEISRTPVVAVDGMATDIPYGRASSTSGSNTSEIMERLLRTAAGLLREGRRLVVMHPDTVGVSGIGDFEVEEEHHLYIHSKLTRTISVLRRV